ncbi:MAG: hypothetical protein CSA33_08325 [Desulfobulbus propionicus]|nr:MAG: hypothetical protein CSA33_08325 [Desulfobulbus propionicus]
MPEQEDFCTLRRSMFGRTFLGGWILPADTAATAVATAGLGGMLSFFLACQGQRKRVRQR